MVKFLINSALAIGACYGGDAIANYFALDRYLTIWLGGCCALLWESICEFTGAHERRPVVGQ